MIYFILIFLLGLIIGSFLNVCIYRIPQNQSIAFPASHCPECQNELRWWYLFPIFSFVFLKGRCAYCARKISIRYPIVELINGLLYLAVFYSFGLTWATLQGLILVSTLLVVSLIDLDHRIIPNQIVIFLVIVSIPLHLLVPNLTWLQMLWGFLVGGGLLLIIAVLSRGGMGGGDIKLMAALGLYLGWEQILMAIFIASLIGSVVGIVLMLFFGKGRKTAIPFGPFLAMGTLVCYLWSDRLISWYLSSML